MPKQKSSQLQPTADAEQVQPTDSGRIALQRRYLVSAAAHATTHLKGKTVLHIEYISDEEMEANEWSHHAPVVVFTDGSSITLQSDAEGNSPGAGRFVGFTADGELFKIVIPSV